MLIQTITYLFSIPESSEDETEDNEEQRYLTTANDQLHSYTANKTSDESEEVNKQSNDIPFASCYQNLLKYDNNFISLLFHIDGIGLFKSSKLKLWLFSTSIIELPPRLRYKRCNMPVVSVWVGYKEPNIYMWLDKSIIVGSVPVKYNMFYYGIIADCPALALILNFINHTGYFCCFYCFIRGQHDRRCRKRQYIYSDTVCTRDPTSFNNHSHSAESNKLKVYGHRGRSILDEIIDVPLPHSIICDYQHVTLLRHFRDVMKAISCSLPTKVRKQIEQKLVKQAFPNFFHRKMRGIENLSFIKATELKNLLFYGFIPNFYKILPIDQAAHMCLFICGIRLLHTSPCKISSSISTMADELLKTYYKHHSDYYKFLANFVLHLHSHFAEIYQRHGSLTYINTFSQEDFIGYISSNRNGTRHLGDLILHYYNIDMYLSNHKSTTSSSSIDQGLDIVLDTHYYKDRMIVLQHAVCSCSSIESCIKFFKRCAKDGYIYHSLLYKKGGNSNNLFVQFSNNGIDLEFGEITIFFQQKDNLYACIRKYNSKYPFSNYFEKSKFYNILHEPLDNFFFVLYASDVRLCISVKEIVKHCVVFLADDDKNCVIVTPISSYDEHD
ncbi:unnamed protein product [Rotaria magnacalcarata]|uniref:Uncharacterized protein n=1 Tax=Rotaria magnacalcarata TaxID=392030 RepID=A0A819WP29_9BILA|nr:unnamed protein product [Rotaria magnacalcarata]